jgi:glycosyltransferase involved in cell wall biosynthesis
MVKLSITIPYYKTYDLTVKLLDKLIPQLTDEVEVYLVDDGCNETRLDEYKNKINIIHLEENVGGASAMNVAIKKVVGKYIAIIDSDDMITDDYIETLLKNIDKHNEDVIFFDWQDMNTKTVVHHPHNYAPWKAIYKKQMMPLFRDGWIYSYDVPFQEDLDKTNYSRYYIDKILYFYNSNRPGNLTLEKKAIIEGRK